MTRSSFALGILFLVGGCGPGEYDVSGRVTFPDGQPLTTGQVIFESAEMKIGGAGTMRPDGTYSTHAPLRAGKYAVYISHAVSEPGGKQERSLVAKKYDSPNTSGLTIDIVRPTEFNIVVDRP